MKNTIIIFFVLCLLTSCGYTPIHTLTKTEKSLKSFTPSPLKNTFILGDSLAKKYEIYIRKNLYEKSIDGYFEMQYLIINGSDVIYISTTPKAYNKSDRGNFFDENYNNKTFEEFHKKVDNCKNGEDYDTCNEKLTKTLQKEIYSANSYYFNKFYFGIKTGTEINFYNKKYKTIWVINKQNADEISVSEININRCKNFRKHKGFPHNKNCNLHYEQSIVPKRTSVINFTFTKLPNFNKFIYYEEDTVDVKRYVEKLILNYRKNRIINSLDVVYKNETENYKSNRIKYYPLEKLNNILGN